MQRRLSVGRWHKATALFFVACSAMTGRDVSAAEFTVEAVPSNMRCLQTAPREELTYPKGMAEQQAGGTIRVRMTFRYADTAPEVEIFYDSVGVEFRAAVIKYISSYRLPCQRTQDAPTVTTQEFVFTPGDGRLTHWAEVRPEPGASPGGQKRSDLLACLAGAGEPPSYPGGTLERRSGVVLTRLSFTSADREPDVEILTNGGSTLFVRVVREYLSHYRLPCWTPEVGPLRVLLPFRFQLDGESRPRLKDASIVGFSAAVDPAYAKDSRFDFTTMSCPFDVRFVFWKPYTDNRVGEVEAPNANRREFIEWLMKVDLKLDDRVRPQVIGDSVLISVPCGVLDLRDRTFTPQEKP